MKPELSGRNFALILFSRPEKKFKFELKLVKLRRRKPGRKFLLILSNQHFFTLLSIF